MRRIVAWGSGRQTRTPTPPGVEGRRGVRYREPDGHAALPASGPAPCPTAARAAPRPPPGGDRDRYRSRSRHSHPDRVRLGLPREGRDDGAVGAGGDRRATGAGRPGDGRQPPDQAPDRRRGRHRDRLPRRGRRRDGARSRRPPGQRRPACPAVAAARRLRPEGSRLVPARGRAGHRGARRGRRAGHRRLFAGRRHRGLDLRLRDRRQDLRLPDRREAERRTVPDRHAQPSGAGSVARRRQPRARVVLEARNGRRRGDRGAAGTRDDTRAPAATTSRSTCIRRPGRCPEHPLRRRRRRSAGA